MEPHAYFDQPQTAAALANLFLLESIALCAPTRELAQGLADGSFFSDLFESTQLLCPTDLRYAAMAYYGKDAEAVYHEINVEYTRLFVSPKRELVPLYESLIVHPGEKTSMFINPTAMHCEQVYRKTGFAFEEKSKFPGDHIGIELRFFACLLARRAQALEENNAQEAEASLQVLTSFAHEHLSRWMESFCAQTTMHAQIPFYIALADVLAQIAPGLA